jgi:hypothetical protein
METILNLIINLYLTAIFDHFYTGYIKFVLLKHINYTFLNFVLRHLNKK